MSRYLEVTKVIGSEWTDVSVAKLKDFWSERGFEFSEGHGAGLNARRGSLWWNFVTFDMARLGTSLTIQPEGMAEIHITMKISTVGQIMTGWNRRYFDLEMEICDSFLTSGDLRKSEWTSFIKESRRASFLWAATLGICGSSPPASVDKK